MHSVLPVVLVASMLAGAGVALAQQVPDTTFDTRIASPAWPEGNGPRLVIDDAHYEFHTMSGRYRPFADLARHDGLRVAAGTRRLDAEALREADLLVIANALGAEDMSDSAAERPAFTPDEIAAVEAWVGAGGSLLLIADHSPMGAAAPGSGRRSASTCATPTASTPRPVDARRPRSRSRPATASTRRT